MSKLFDTCNKKLRLYTGLTVSLRHFFFLSKYFKLKKDLALLESQRKDTDEYFKVTKLFPCYEDISAKAGGGKGIYFFQDLYVAQRIFKNNPVRHIDIGSRIDGFVAHVAAYRNIDVADIRPLEDIIPNVHFIQADLMKRDGLEKECTDSISSLHALEHFGLGRYGDTINYNGYLLGFKNITYMLKPGGKFYFSVPLGEQRIEFHAHRVFSLSYLLKLVSEDYEVDRFSFIDDKGYLHADVKIDDEMIKTNCDCHYGCAVFELTKRS